MKLKCGIFLDRKLVVVNDLDAETEAHAFIRRKQRENAESAGLEYYYKEGGKTYIVENPTLTEKAFAQATRTTGKNVVGYRNISRRVADTTELKFVLEEVRAYEAQQMQ